jgi:hypothetical protein
MIINSFFLLPPPPSGCSAAACSSLAMSFLRMDTEFIEFISSALLRTILPLLQPIKRLWGRIGIRWIRLRTGSTVKALVNA